MIDINYEVFVEEFYDKLFELLPETTKRLSSDKSQRLMMIVVMKIIDDLQSNSTLQDDYLNLLGQQHKGYGVTLSDMQVGEEAFLNAIRASVSIESSIAIQQYQKIYQKIVRAMMAT